MNWLPKLTFRKANPPPPSEPVPDPLEVVRKSARSKVRCRFIEDADYATSYEIVQRFTFCDVGPRSSSAARSLKGLMVPVGLREEDVPIRKVTAVTHSAGDFVGNLPRVLPTISDPPDWIAAMSREEQLKIVKENVWREFPTYGGRFRLVEEGWSGRLIGCNTGASRRFAMLHCEYFPEPLMIPATIERYEFDPEAFRALTEDYWLVLLPDDVVETFLNAARQAEMEGVEQLTKIYHLAGPRRENVNWALICCPVSAERYRDFREAVQDAPVPHFDVSQWLRLLQSGWKKP